MADDNIQLNPGVGGKILASKDTNAVQHQRVLIETLNAQGNPQDTALDHPVPVQTQAIVDVRQARGDVFDRWTVRAMLRDQAGSDDASGIYTGGNAEPFWIDPPAGSILEIDSFAVVIGTDKQITPAGYGMDQVPLPNGLEFRVMRSGGAQEVHQVFDAKLTSNFDLARYADVMNSGEFGDPQFVTLHFTEAVFNAGGLRLFASRGERFEVYLSDDMTNAVQQQHFRIAGRIYGEDDATIPGK